VARPPCESAGRTRPSAADADARAARRGPRYFNLRSLPGSYARTVGQLAKIRRGGMLRALSEGGKKEGPPNIERTPGLAPTTSTLAAASKLRCLTSERGSRKPRELHPHCARSERAVDHELIAARSRSFGRVVGHERRAGEFCFGPTRSKSSSRVSGPRARDEPAVSPATRPRLVAFQSKGVR
jgi:hypothetical protein